MNKRVEFQPTFLASLIQINYSKGCDSGFGNLLALRLNQIGFKVYATVHNTNSPGALQLKESAIFGHKLIVFKMDVTNDCEVNEIQEKVKRDLRNSGEI